MSKNLQLHIPAPCHEDWAAMKPEEKGRFCVSCCKTVTDFSLMSDREVVNYLAGAAGKVCGRFTEDQLQRELMPRPLKKRKAWVVWNVLLIGLLGSLKSRGQTKPARPASHQVMGAPARMVVGKMAAMERTDTRAIRADSPHYAQLPPVEVIGYRTTGRVDIAGGVRSVSGDTLYCSVSGIAISGWISDSLSFLGLGKKEFALYPNPVSRGTVIKLSLNTGKTGKGMVGIYNAAGALVQEKVIELDGGSQIELLAIPASLPGGLYFVKLSAPELKKVYTQKLMIL
jgi:hypothetical protein